MASGLARCRLQWAMKYKVTVRDVGERGNALVL
jgi:hypothetical protein